MSTPRLLASCWTHAGDAAPQRGDEISPFALDDRIDAVASAGWRGIGLVHADLEHARRTGGWDRIAERLAANDLDVEVEFLGDWWTDGERRAASDAIRRDLIDAMAALGARTLKVCGETTGAPADPARMAEEFAALCDEVAVAGGRVALEAMPFSNFATVEEGAAFVQGVGHPAGGLCVDAWHVFRGGSPLESIKAAIDPAHLFVVELCDALAATPPDLWVDTIDERRLPGDGEWDLRGFIRTIRELGFDGPWGVEIISREHRARTLDDAVTAAFAATVRELAAA